MTLVELTVVILVLLALVSLLFLGAQAWKRGSDRGVCILNIRHVQQGMRSWSNLYGYSPGSTVAGLQGFVIGPGLFVEDEPVCPGGGVYSTPAGDMIPLMGDLYLECSFGSSLDHEPRVHADW